MAEFESGRRRADSPPLLAWDDVLHIKPRYRITRADYDEIRAADAEHRAPKLTEEALAAVESRQRFLDDIRNTNVPEWRRALVKIVSQLDNVQDQLSTVAWITGPLLDRLGTKGKAIHATAEASATAINWLQTIVAGPQPGRSAKHRRAVTRAANARASRGVVGTLQRGVEWVRRNQGHLVEASQATDTWFGVGLSLGAIFGALEETYWTTGKQAYHIGLTLLNSTIAELGGFSPEGRAAAMQAANKYAQAGIEDPLPPPLKVVDWLAQQLEFTATQGTIYTNVSHALDYLLGPTDVAPADAALVALAALKQNTLLAPTLPAIEDAIGRDAVPNLLMPQPRIRDPLSRYLLERSGASFDPLARPLGAYRAFPQTVQEHMDELLPQYIEHAKPWLPPADVTGPHQVLHQLVEANQAATAAMLTGNVDGIAEQYAPEDAAIFAAIDQGAHFPPNATREQLAGWFHAMELAQTVNPDAWTRGGAARITSAYFRSPATAAP